MTNKTRCAWAETNELFIPYHDNEWGVPEHDDQKLFEMINLEGAQAGLSWLTILKRRDTYRAAFDNFVAEKISKYDDAKRQELLKNEGIIRNKLKVNAVIENAKMFLAVQKEFGSFDAYLWKFVDNKPLMNPPQQIGQELSTTLSKDLKKHGFRFVGPTIVYAFMQAVGMVNDHEPTCFKYGI